MVKYSEIIIIPIDEGIQFDNNYLVEVEESLYKFEDNFKKEYDINKGFALFNLGFQSKQKMSLSFKYLYHISKFFLTQLIEIPDLDDLREQVNVILSDEKIDYFIRISPFINQVNIIDKKWIKNIWSLINNGFHETCFRFEGSIKEYLYKLDKSLVNIGKVCFHLVENKLDPSAFAFMATFQTFDLKSGKVRDTSLRKTLENNNQEQLLKVLGPITNLASSSKLIHELLESGEIFYPITLNKDETYKFLTEIPLYEQAGIVLKVPNWWKKKYKTSLGVNIGNKKSYLNFDEIADFQIEMHLGNLNINLADLENIIKLENGLTKYKGEWIEIDKNKLLELKEAYMNVINKLDNKSLTLFEALKLELGEVKSIQNLDIDIEITQGQWIKETLLNLELNNDNIELTEKDFKANLRPYQIKGVNWLSKMKKLRLGCCLADDMGLGKTIQVLAFLNEIKKNHEKSLLIIPSSLIGNWSSEITKFAPHLKFYIFHPNFNISKDVDITSFDLIITTYSMISKIKILKDTKWDNIILDEAQAIKNPSTLQSKNIRSLNAKYKVALTGTPIENRLSDLWSIFDFINKGLLGSSSEFKEFVKELNNDYSYYDHLKDKIKPFILRRLKTDKSIINDLPDKIENKVYVNLSIKQLALYKELLEDLKEKLDQMNGVNRKGLILQSIIKFKQICNHPSQYLGLSDYNDIDSSKFELLKDICENIALNHERVLIFTQFKEITSPLDEYLYEVFGKRGLVLTGSTPITKRKEYVDLFQSNEYIPYMVITVKAGGVGLNLTRANHVIHFDRWWNPAVENQATDRVYRIGQNKNVLVYKFITKNTIEEKIDTMIMDKLVLSENIIGENSEGTIMNMSNEEIINLFRLEE